MAKDSVDVGSVDVLAGLARPRAEDDPTAQSRSRGCDTSPCDLSMRLFNVRILACLGRVNTFASRMKHIHRVEMLASY